MRMSVVGGVALALTVPSAVAPSAGAARDDGPGKLPDIVSPRAGDVLHNEFTAEAHSSHGRVEFVLDDFDREVTVSPNVVVGPRPP